METNEGIRLDSNSPEEVQAAALGIPLEADDTPTEDVAAEPQADVEDSPSEPIEDTQEEQPAKPNRAERRWQQLLHDRAALRDQVQQLQGQIELLAQQQQQPAVQPDESAPQPMPDLPNRFDYDSDQDWMTAVLAKQQENTQRAIQEALTAQQQQQEQVRQQQAQSQVDERWAESCREANDRLPDYMGVLNDCTENVSDNLSVLLKQHPNGAELLYHMAKEPGTITRLNAMDPQSAMFAMGQLWAQNGQPAQANTPATPPRRPRAAPTVTPVRDSAPTDGSPGGPPDQMSYRDYRKWRDSGGGR